MLGGFWPLRRTLNRMWRDSIREGLPLTLFAQGTLLSMWAASWANGYGWDIGSIATIVLCCVGAVRLWWVRPWKGQRFADFRESLKGPAS